MSKAVLQKVNDRLVVKGNTFPIKTQLKQLGLRWYAPGKYWQTQDTSDYMIECIQHIVGTQEPSRIVFAHEEEEQEMVSGGVKVHFEGEENDNSRMMTRRRPATQPLPQQPVRRPVVREEVFVNQDAAIQLEVYQDDQGSWW